jgi:hypothetical protein
MPTLGDRRDAERRGVCHGGVVTSSSYSMDVDPQSLRSLGPRSHASLLNAI